MTWQPQQQQQGRLGAFKRTSNFRKAHVTRDNIGDVTWEISVQCALK